MVVWSQARKAGICAKSRHRSGRRRHRWWTRPPTSHVPPNTLFRVRANLCKFEQICVIFNQLNMRLRGGGLCTPVTAWFPSVSSQEFQTLQVHRYLGHLANTLSSGTFKILPPYSWKCTYSTKSTTSDGSNILFSHLLQYSRYTQSIHRSTQMKTLEGGIETE